MKFKTTVRNNSGAYKIIMPEEIRLKYQIKRGAKDLEKQVGLFKFDDKYFIGILDDRSRITLRKDLFKNLSIGSEIEIDLIEIKTLKELTKREKNKIIDNKYNLKSIIPEFSEDKKPVIIFDLNDNEFIVSYYSGSYTPFSVVLPKYIEIKPTNEIIGLYITEGGVSDNIDGISLVNTERIVIDKFYEFLTKQLKIKEELLRVNISYYNLDTAKEYWKDYLINRKVIFSDLTGVKSENGALKIVINRRALKPIFYGLLYNLQDEILKNDNYGWQVLRGVFAGDGNVDINEYKSIKGISISVTRPKVFRFYKEILASLNLRISRIDYDNGNYMIRLWGFDNISKLYKNRIFDLHETRKDTFLKGFNKNSFTILYKKYLIPFKQNSLMDRMTLSQFVNIKNPTYMCDVLTNLVKNDFLNRKAIDNRGKFVYNLTEKGFKTLELIEED